MRNTIIFTLGVSTAIFLGYTLNKNNTEESTLAVEPHDHSVHDHQDAHAENVAEQRIERGGQVLSTGDNMFNEKSPSAEKDTVLNLQEKDTVVWQVSEKAEEALKNSEFQVTDLRNEAYIEMDTWEMDNLEIGDYMDLYIPQIGGSFTGEVDHITSHANGDRTVEAYIPGAGSLFSAVITYSDNAIYGTIGTQDDVYIIEGDGRNAWIASKRDLTANHQEIMPEPPTQTAQQTGADPFAALGK